MTHLNIGENKEPILPCRWRQFQHLDWLKWNELQQAGGQPMELEIESRLRVHNRKEQQTHAAEIV